MRMVRSLWWKLTLSYLVITLAVVTTAMLVLGPWFGQQDFHEALRPTIIELPVKRAVRLLRGRNLSPCLASQTCDTELSQQVLTDLVNDLQGGDAHTAAITAHVANSPGLSAVRSAQPKVSVAIYSPTGVQLHVREDLALLMPTQWRQNDASTSALDRDHIQIVMPMHAGLTMVVRFYARYNFWRQFGESGKEVAFSVVFQALFYTLPGALFGVLFGTWLSRRLRRFSAIAQRWAAGDFSQRLADMGGDELSQHADLLDCMADDLSAQLRLQQQLSTAEARNHLARELHDSVKQQCFGVGLQLHAAQSWLKRDVVKSAQLLAQAQSLNQSVQAELVGILQRLKPGSVPAPSLAQSLRELAAHWTNEVAIEIHLDDTMDVTEPIAHELVRIASEALANVVRHARASQCVLTLAQADGCGVMSIKDNGCGFAPDHANTGLGLHNLRERAQGLPGGAMTIHSNMAGTELSLRWIAAEFQLEGKG